MTMVICKECKAQISTLAVACLHCGGAHANGPRNLFDLDQIREPVLQRGLQQTLQQIQVPFLGAGSDNARDGVGRAVALLSECTATQPRIGIAHIAGG